ncbi:nitrogen fixation protein FixH [Achromobacter sp. NPDC058515]|uniref:nitrogen fixation protein FixH n=1 Tax=Achromobacter sp. NPDC058515 TaxID=3346533 RepID=UPI003647632D
MNAAQTAAAQAKPAKPWYREPWPWILMAGPFAAMLGCFVTIYLAVTQFGSQPIREGVVKRGLVIEQAAPNAGEGMASLSAGAAPAKP